jgi:hypothetical protein
MTVINVWLMTEICMNFITLNNFAASPTLNFVYIMSFVKKMFKKKDFYLMSKSNL